MKFFYHILWVIVSPLLPFYLRRRAKKNPAYLQHWGERFGQPFQGAVQEVIWIHAVSVGETRAAAPLIKALQSYYPDTPFLLTQMTPTGRETALQLYPNIQCRYLPYDKPEWVAQFLSEHRPKFGILMETEIWPNLIEACAIRQIPLFLANARLSARSQKAYQRVAYFIRPVLGQLTGCFAQTDDDVQRLQSIGVKEPIVCGNTKYDMKPNQEAFDLADVFRQRIGKRPIFVVASTRYYHQQDEAELILRAWQQHQIKNTKTLLVVIPRHPERFQAAFECAKSLGFKVQKRSDNEAVRADTQVWIGDSMGELWAYYLVADIAFVGGSLVDSGCQNIIEPLVCGKPILFGFSTYHFQAACKNALQAKVAIQVHSAQELVEKANDWLSHPDSYAEYAQRAAKLICQHQGAGERMAKEIVDRLSSSLSKNAL